MVNVTTNHIHLGGVPDYGASIIVLDIKSNTLTVNRLVSKGKVFVQAYAGAEVVEMVEGLVLNYPLNEGSTFIYAEQGDIKEIELTGVVSYWTSVSPELIKSIKLNNSNTIGVTMDKLPDLEELSMKTVGVFTIGFSHNPKLKKLSLLGGNTIIPPDLHTVPLLEEFKLESNTPVTPKFGSNPLMTLIDLKGGDYGDTEMQLMATTLRDRTGMVEGVIKVSNVSMKNAIISITSPKNWSVVVE